MNKTNVTKWYQLSVKEVLKELNTDIKKGLTEKKVDLRRSKFGENILEEGETETFVDKIIKQVRSPLVFILTVAGIGTFLLGEYLDTGVIFIAVLINIIIGVFQENKASSAFEKLVQSQEKYATVIREGKKIVVKATKLVVGDIVSIEAGMYVPADMRVITQNNVSVNESALTGEWVNVSKDSKKLKSEEHVTGQTNMLWMGTLVSSGVAEGVVINVGERTQIGMVAKSLAYAEDTQTPLQKSIKKLAKFLAKFTLAVVVVILLIGIWRGESFASMLLVSIALAVAVMPEGMPAALTVVLALGMEAILKKGGLVRNLLAAETLGSTTVILTDKTGTLTLAEMRVSDILTLHSLKSKKSDEKELFSDGDKRTVLNMAMLTSDAFVEGGGEDLSKLVVRGRPVERAIVLAGLDVGLTQVDLLKIHTQLDFFPFESKKRFVASLNKTNKSKINRLHISGAPELLLEKASFVYSNGRKLKLTDKVRKYLSGVQKIESSKGMRLIGIAYKDVDSKEKFKKRKKDTKSMLNDIVFAGFIVLHDPIRKEVPNSIRVARQAGARIIMLTGDNPETAAKIATEAGIRVGDSTVLTGTDIEDYSDTELLEVIKKTDVFARVLPDQKLRIARLLKGSGEVVAMTGDGINDAPALRSADIGIALGSGTEVAKEASDVILMNNSFSIIVDAIEEGRRILDNIKKIVAYLLSTGFSELFVVVSALVASSPLPFLPAQILWVNILQEGFMNFAFAFEPKETDVMKRNPNKESMKHIITNNLKILITLVVLITGVSLMIFYFYLISLDLPIKEVRTLMFMALSVGSIFFSFSIKNLHKPIWKIKFLSNKYLLYSVSLSIAMLIGAITFPPLQKLLSLTTPTTGEFGIIFVFGLFNLAVIELVKYIVFEKNKKTK